MTPLPTTSKPCGYGLLLIATLVTVASGSWNLPYQQGPQYDYSQYYDTALVQTLKIVPDYFKTSMTKGWTYYKAHYMMSNGLVNHMRLVNGAVIGTTEAVSEGQGYGMILAVLNNDQATFNRIFEAANQYMWDDSRKSYYKWQYPSGGTGAATDADIDVGLALVFADMLVKRNLWGAYTKTPNYTTRANEVIQSIRSHMTSNDYLLPGDNWGSDGINNINPSYFATGWMKVFNSYQTTANFTPVIDKCYQVLVSRGTQYNKGQAPDWCTSSGGTASKGAPGMGNDAIRTPYRIAMDALWYNDSRAVKFCSNAKNTLTQYANMTNRSLVLAQMAQYDQNTAIVASTAGGMKEAAMWECAALGSKEPAFSKGCLSTQGIGLIVGQDPCFGSIQQSDHEFYFNQSLGILGFAVITGQFPNIYEDLKNGVPAAVRSPERKANSALMTMRRVPGGFEFSANASLGAVGSLSLEIYDLKGARIYTASTRGPGTEAMLVPMKNAGTYVAKATARYAGQKAAVESVEKIFWK
jgi:endo-1,4-beta-D-glucanase Y